MNVFKFAVILLLLSCNASDKDNEWKNNKSDSEINPPSKIQFVEMNNFVSITGTQLLWINKGLVNYPYKKNCPDKVTIAIDLNDSQMHAAFEEDSLSFAYYVLNQLKAKGGVSHFAFQTLNNNKLQICFYMEKGLSVLKTLRDAELPLNAKIETDANWSAYMDFAAKK